MTIQSGDILKTTVSFLLNDGTIAQNIFHHKRYGTLSLANQWHVDAIENWVEGLYDEIDVQVSDDVVVQLCSLDRVAWTGSKWEVAENIGVFTPTFTPSGSGEALPNQMSAFVVYKTERPKSVGRKFLIPFEEAWQNGSYLEAGALAAVVAWAADSLLTIVLGTGTGLTPGIVRTGVEQFLPFTVGVVTNVLGTQRRRRPGVGA